jgi:hypothetical protein
MNFLEKDKQLFLSLAPPRYSFLVTDTLPFGRVDPAFPLLTGLFVVAILLDIGKNTGPFACFTEAPKSFFKSLIIANYNAIHAISPHFL